MHRYNCRVYNVTTNDYDRIYTDSLRVACRRLGEIGESVWVDDRMVAYWSANKQMVKPAVDATTMEKIIISGV